MVRAYVIETVDLDGTEWGVGLDSPNPPPDHYFKMASEGDAFRLKRLLDDSDTEVRRIWKIARDGYDLMDDETSWAQLTGYHQEIECRFGCNSGSGERCSACV